MGFPFSMFSQVVADFEADIKQGCIPLQVTYTNRSTVAGVPIDKTKYIFRWEMDELQNTEKKKDTVVAMYVNAGKKSVKLTILNLDGSAVAGANTSKTQSNLITVFPNPSVQAVVDKSTTCINDPINFSVNNLTPTAAPLVSYLWDFGDGNNYEFNQNTSHAYTTKASYNATVYATDANGCSSTKATSKSVTIIVNSDRPISDFTMDNDRTCNASLAVNFTNNSSFANGTITGYKWDFSDGTSETTKNASKTFTRTSNQDTKVVSLYVYGNNGCTSIPKTTTVTLYKLDPLITITDAYKTVIPLAACSGTVSFSTTQENNTSYQWQVGSTKDFTNAFSTTLASGAYTVSLTATNPACSLTVSKSFNVEPVIGSSITPLNSFDCATSMSKSFTLIPNPGIGIAYARWYTNTDTAAIGVTSGVSGPTHLFAAGTAYDIIIKVITTNGCKGTITFPQTVQVYYPNVQFSLDSNRQCVPFGVDFTNQTSYTFPGLLPVGTNPDFVSTVTWDFGDGSPLVINPSTSEIKHVYTTDSTFHVILHIKTNRAAGGECDDIKVKHEVKMGTKPQIKIAFLDTIVCAGYTMSNLPNKSGVWYSDWSYIENANGTKNTTKVDSTNAQFYRVDQKTGSSTRIIQNITYKDTLHAMFNNSAVNDTGLYYLQISDFYNGCRSDSTFYTTPKHKVDSLYIHVQGPIVYQNQIYINCKDPFKIGIGVDTIRAASTWKWQVYKDGNPKKQLAVISSPEVQKNFDFEHAPYQSGIGPYSSVLHGYNTTTNCQDSSKVTFIITKPKAVISVADTTPCVNTSHLLSLDTLHDVGYIRSSLWSLTLPDGSYDTTTIHQSSTHQHLNAGLDELSKRLYHFKDKNIVYEAIDFPLRGVYQLFFRITDLNNCSDSIIVPIRAYQPKAAFTTIPVTDCLPITVPFNDASIDNLLPAYRPIVSREWYTNGDTAQFLTGNKLKVSDTYHEKKSYSIRLKVTDDYGCTNDTTSLNGVTPIIPPATIIPVGKVCLGTEAVFHVDSLMGSPYTSSVDSFVWDFGDGTHLKTTLFTAKHTYATEVTYPKVTVKAYKMAPSTHVCSNADSNITTDIKDASAKISFVDQHSNPDSCKYGFIKVNTAYTSRYKTAFWYETYGNVTTYKGNISTANITFPGFGLHTIWLATTSDYKGCETDSSSLPHTIPSSSFEIVADKSDLCIKEPIRFSLKNVVNVSSYPHKWTFGDGNIESDSLSINYSYNTVFADPKVQVSFVVENGCNDFDTTTINLQQVMAKFDCGLNDKTTIGCVPFIVDFHNKSLLPPLTYSWSFDDGSTETIESPTHIFKEPNKTYNVKLNIQGPRCKDEISKAITTYQSPSFTSSLTNTICQDSILQIKITPSPGTVIESWEPDPTLTLSPNNLTAVVTPPKTTKYFVNAEYINVATGISPCKVKDTIEVKVQLRPSYLGAPHNYLVYIPNDTLSKKPKNELFPFVTYSLNNIALSGISYEWTPSTWLSCDNCPNPTIRVEEDKDVQYIVTMTDTLGCFTERDTLNFKLIAQTAAGLPSAFTPNSGKNDFAIPRGWGVKDFLEIDIYNRWGQLVYKSDKMLEGWDGTFNGRPQDPDTYAWTIRFKDSKDIVQEKKGYITLLR